MPTPRFDTLKMKRYIRNTKWTLPLLYSYPQWTLPPLHCGCNRPINPSNWTKQIYNGLTHLADLDNGHNIKKKHMAQNI